MHPRTLLTIHERQHASRQIILGHPLAVRGGVQDSRCAVPGMSAPAETLKGSSLSLRHLRPPLQQYVSSGTPDELGTSRRSCKLQ